MFDFLIRIVLFFFGLLFAASLAVAALLLLAVWGLRMAWARLTGKPVTPWTVMFGQRFDPRQGFDRFRAAAGRASRGPSAADVTAARAHGESTRSPVIHKLGRGGREGDITDVHARPVDSPG